VVGAALPIPGVVVETEYATAYWHPGAVQMAMARRQAATKKVLVCVCVSQKQKKQRTTKEC